MNRERPAAQVTSHDSATPRLLDSTLIIFSDFDGTITQADVTDRILEELAHPMWREVEDEWVRGLIGSRECLERQIALVDASLEQLNALIDAIPLDPTFGAFYQFTGRQGIPFYVVSDGFDYVISRILKRAGVNGDLENGRHLYASHLEIAGRRLAASFPHSDSGCTHGCATCKAAVIRRLRGKDSRAVFIGDGFSDRFAVEEADVVFAKKQLLGHCRRRNLSCRAFEAFADVQAKLGDRARGRETRTLRQGAKGPRAMPVGRVE
jgi:2-hydroxy-3-keto-5-methylthiopentenyl-1-phosphate phosphatase